MNRTSRTKRPKTIRTTSLIYGIAFDRNSGCEFEDQRFDLGSSAPVGEVFALYIRFERIRGDREERFMTVEADLKALNEHSPPNTRIV